MTASPRTKALVRTLLPRVLDGVERELATAMGPEFQPGGRFGGRVLRLVRTGAELVCASAETGSPVGPEALRPFAESARLHAANGLTAQALRLGVVTSYTGALRTALAEAARNDREALMPLVSWTARLGPLIEQTEMTAFLDWHRQSGRDRRWRRETTRALLGGVRVESVTAPGYLVCLVGPGSKLSEEDVQLRAISGALEDSGALVLSRRRFVVLLHPLAGPPIVSARRPAQVMVPVLDLLGLPVRVATAGAVPGGITAGYREALGVWRLLCRHGYPQGRFDVFSVAGEHLVGADSGLAVRLRGLLAPIAESPVLVDTLRQWLRGDLDRRQVAAALHVHPNTLDRRLRQIEDRTGLSVVRNGDLFLLRLALSA